MLTQEQWYQVLLKLTRVKGAEGEENPPSDPPKEDEEDEEDDEEEDPPKGNKPDTSGLESALKKERAERKRLEKEAKQLRRFREEAESKDATEAQKATKKAEAADAKAAKLAQRLVRQEVDLAISRFATSLKFRDVGDALAQVERDLNSWVTQDEDDPSEIEVDERAVEKAVKALADRKKYLLEAEGEQEPSGSKFGGSKKSQDEMDEAALRAKYPALRRPAQSST